jgi:hypothetical protein
MGSDVFRLDNLAFFEPLDAEFLSVVDQLARRAGVEFVSFFWGNLFLGYLAYDPSLDTISYADISKKVNAVTSTDLAADAFSPTGFMFRALTLAGVP